MFSDSSDTDSIITWQSADILFKYSRVVTFSGDGNMPHWDSQDWLKHHLPCKHRCAVMKLKGLHVNKEIPSAYSLKRAGDQLRASLHAPIDWSHHVTNISVLHLLFEEVGKIKSLTKQFLPMDGSLIIEEHQVKDV